MKKVYYISTLLLTLCLGLASCNNEEDDVFKDSAAVRLENAINDYTAALSANGGKWQMQYFANSGEEGYDYVVTFNADGSVRFSGNNQYIGGSYKTETSLWQVIADDGPVLSFNSYNKIFHVFSDPADIPQTQDVNETGRGHEGDYEFIINKIQGDTAILVGKKHGLTILMTRLPSTTDDATYFSDLATLAANSFSPAIPNLILTTKAGKRWVVSNASSLIWKFYPEGGDPIVETVTRNAIFTPQGVRFMNPLTFLNGTDSTAVAPQEFRFQADGSLLAKEDNATTVKSPDLSNMLNNEDITWRIKDSGNGGTLGSLYDALVSEFYSYNKSRLQYVQFTYDTNAKEHYFVMRTARSGRYMSFTYPVTITAVDANTVTLAFAPGIDNNSTIYAKNIAAINNLMNGLTGKISLSSGSAIAPTVIKLASASDANSFLNVAIQ
jgi:hypothetical protein